MPRCCCCSFRLFRRSAPISPPCVRSGRNGATGRAASRTARQRARNSPVSSHLEPCDPFTDCAAIVLFCRYALFGIFGGIPGTFALGRYNQRAQRPSKQALTPAICKKSDVGTVCILDDERRQQLAGMPEACEVAIYITAHVYGSNIRRRAGSSRSCTDVHFHIIVKKCPVQALPTPGKR